MVLSAHLTVGIVVIGGAYLFARYARAGCIDAVSLATAGYMIVGLVAYWISTSPLLRQRPWALIALVSGTTGGFITLHYVLSLEPGCVPEYPMASLAIDFVVSLTVLIALVVLFEAGRRAQVNADSITRTNEELAVSTIRIQRTNAVTRSSMAQILHGGVQGRLSSMSLAIRRYVDSETSGQQMSLMDLKQRLDFQLMEVRDELAHLTSTTRNTQVNVEDGLRKAIMQWRGLLAISYEITPQASSELATRNYLSWAASEIIDAAITNSNLHGHAAHVWITIAVDSPDDASFLEVTIEDDGIGPPSDIHPGMGLESVSAFGGTWQFTSGFQGGCQLKTRLPIS
jgi:signal transduction histidine kinase